MRTIALFASTFPRWNGLIDLLQINIVPIICARRQLLFTGWTPHLGGVNIDPEARFTASTNGVLHQLGEFLSTNWTYRNGFVNLEERIALATNYFHRYSRHLLITAVHYPIPL